MVCHSVFKFFFLIVINNFINGIEECYLNNDPPLPQHTGIFPQNYDAELVGKY